MCWIEVKTHIRHECLESHILDSSDVLCSLEVLARPVFSAFPCIVYEVLGYFTEGTAFFAEVDNNTTTALLRFLHCLFNTKGEVWTACANVRPENVTAVAFVVNTECQADIRVRHLCWVAEDVYGKTTNGREEELDVVARNQLGVRAASLLEQCSTECPLVW